MALPTQFRLRTTTHAGPAGADEGLVVRIELSDEIRAREFLDTRGSNESGKRVLVAKAGDSFQHSTGRWLDFVQVKDLARGLWRKRLEYQSTGEIYRDEERPLDEHVSTEDKIKRAGQQE